MALEQIALHGNLREGAVEGIRLRPGLLVAFARLPGNRGQTMCRAGLRMQLRLQLLQALLGSLHLDLRRGFQFELALLFLFGSVRHGAPPRVFLLMNSGVNAAMNVSCLIDLNAITELPEA